MKKLLSLILLTALFCTLLPAALAESEIPFQVENGGFETGDFTGWTLPEGWPVDEQGNPLYAADLSAAQDQGVIGWINPSGNLIIAGEGGVKAPENSAALFSGRIVFSGGQATCFL